MALLCNIVDTFTNLQNFNCLCKIKVMQSSNTLNLTAIKENRETFLQ